MRVRLHLGWRFARRGIVILSAVILISGCQKSLYRVSRPQLGTIINITLIGEMETARKASEAVFIEIARIEDLMSPYRTSSDIYRINKFASLRPVVVSNETFRLVQRAVDISEKTGGAFDITFAPLAGLWDLNGKNFKPPAQNDIKKILPLVNYRNIKLIEKDHSIQFLRRGMRIGLGGIAKGYAVECALKVMKDNGITSGIIEEGGDLQVAGDKFGKQWVTGLRDPRKNSLLLSVVLEDGESIATSGDYERYAMYEGKRYHHIIDPKTGYPAETFTSVSVISEDPIVSDSYATAFFVMGFEKTVTFLKKREDLAVILVDSENRIYISSSLKKRIDLLENIRINWL